MDYTSVASGVWSNSNIWNPSGVPGANDNVTVSSNDTVTVNSENACANLSAGGTLRIGSVDSAAILTVGGDFSGSASVGYYDEGEEEYYTGTIKFVGGTSDSPKTLGGVISGGSPNHTGKVLLQGWRATTTGYTIGQSSPLEWYISGGLKSANGNGQHFVIASGATVIVAQGGKLDFPEPSGGSYVAEVRHGGKLYIDGELKLGTLVFVGTSGQSGGVMEIRRGGEIRTYAILGVERGVSVANGGLFVNKGTIRVTSGNIYGAFLIQTEAGGKAKLWRFPRGEPPGFGVVTIRVVSGELEIAGRSKDVGQGGGYTESCIRSDRIPRGGGVRLAG